MLPGSKILYYTGMRIQHDGQVSLSRFESELTGLQSPIDRTDCLGAAALACSLYESHQTQAGVEAAELTPGHRQEWHNINVRAATLYRLMTGLAEHGAEYLGDDVDAFLRQRFDETA